MKLDKYDVRSKLLHPQEAIPVGKKVSGSTKDKYPVVLDGGRTIIFISNKSKEQETVERYKTRGYKRP